MTTLAIKKGDTKKLPPNAFAFTVGVGWAAAGGVGESPDLDVWVIRRKGTVGEAICWAHTAWLRPDLGTNTQGSPYIATPELDVIHQGDDRTGAESDDDYDEIVKLDLSKAPADVTAYEVFATYYEDPDTGSGKTLGMAENIKCGVKDENTGHMYESQLGNDFGFDVTVHICTIRRDGSNWVRDEVQEGTSDTMFVVAGQHGVS